MTVIETLRAAWPLHKTEAAQAFTLFDSWCSAAMRRRVPGMGTTERLTIRIYSGKTVEQAAAAEYLYRWHLAIKAPDQCGATGAHDWRSPASCVSVFGTPHAIGM